MTPKENEEIVIYRFEKAKKTLGEAEMQIQSKLWNVAINRLYYACFYAVSALLASKEIFTRTHAGAKQMFNMHFIKSGIIDERFNKFYTEIFGMRQTGDYEDFCDYEQEDVLELVDPAKELIKAIENILYKKNGRN
ncbi:MAG: HEPN domain-containing protein [Bacteroidia bacterium]